MNKRPDNQADLIEELESLRAENLRLNSYIKESEQFFDVVANTASEMFWASDTSHRFTYMSPRVVDVVDIEMSKQLGHTRAELAHDDLESERWKQHFADLDAHRPFDKFNYTRINSKNEIRYITATGRPVFDHGGEFQGYVGTSEDITDRLEIEKKAKTAESFLLAAINSLEVIFAIWDSEDRLIFSNQYFNTLNETAPGASTFGITFEEHLHKIAEYNLLGDAEDKDEWIANRLERHKNPEGPFEVQRQNDKTILVQETRLEDGSTIILSMDISEQRKSELALHESERRLLDFGTIAADWFWEMDADLRFTFMSTHHKANIHQDLIGKTRFEIAMGHVSEQEIEAHRQILLRREPFSDFRYSQRNPDGSDIFISVYGKPIFSNDGTFIGYRGVGQDITDLVMTEMELRNQKEIAEQASRTKSEFLAHMSHELRTPLNAILGFSEVISQQSFGPIGNVSYVEYASDIHTSGMHLLSLINDLLDLSKIEAGKFELNEERIDLVDAIDQSKRLFLQPLEDRNIELNCSIADDARYLFSDHRAFTQILYNLLSNAEKFSKEGGKIEVTTRLNEQSCIEVVVTDTGCGFDINDVKTAITPFGRVKNPMTTKTPGTGLGLPIVKALMEIHGGKLSVHSRLDVGTTVILEFPSSRTLK